ncbi:acetoacetate decarboxylase family protein [Natrinema salifodinae]|uniref:Acetoacetate decarboxylase (ADC) n=1 Tax=Natrinema salifodinae TaxID=1202768 RepID=A0A1I0PI57_9EURY|nr:acetoacetate decarboxylase family protein [Natrinema salifodinae]SEW13904.1 Acetoacetate decarboxylase (ADC) [Natrinema salifodinae]
MTTVDERTRRRLSTGHVVELPLDLSFAMGGVTLPARRDRLAAILPDGLSPLAIAPGVGCVALVGIRYHRVGREVEQAGDGADGAAETGLDPYDEFAVIVPAVRGSRTDLPGAQLAGGEVGGYVHWLPVTTEPSVALGRELWGFPKEVADVTVTDGPGGVRVAVAGDGAREPVRLEIAHPRFGPKPRDWTLWSYTTKDGDLLRAKARIAGDVAIGVGSATGTRLDVPSGLADELGLWRRPLGRLYGSSVRARLFAGEPIGDDE